MKTIVNGFPKGVIGKDMYSDSTLESMKKSELINLLHVAQHNYEVLLEFYSNVVNNSLKELEQIKADLKSGGWIPCSERMPEVETEVLILAKRKYRGGGHKYIVTTALYEDGTVRENDSCWRWEDIDGEWDEEEDCLIIPEGWWEYRHFNADEVYNNEVDCEVIGWQPLPEKPEEEQQVRTAANHWQQ